MRACSGSNMSVRLWCPFFPLHLASSRVRCGGASLIYFDADCIHCQGAPERPSGQGARSPYRQHQSLPRTHQDSLIAKRVVAVNTSVLSQASTSRQVLHGFSRENFGGPPTSISPRCCEVFAALQHTRSSTMQVETTYSQYTGVRLPQHHVCDSRLAAVHGKRLRCG